MLATQHVHQYVH